MKKTMKKSDFKNVKKSKWNGGENEIENVEKGNE